MVAKHHLDRYQFPAMMMVVLPNGTIIHSVNSNEFMETAKEDASILDGIVRYVDPIEESYIRFLMEGLEKVKAVWKSA